MKLKELFNRKKVIALVATVLLLTVAAGATLAYILTNTDPVENVFTLSKVACAVVENDNAPVTGSDVKDVSVKEKVKIQNTGDTDAFIRVAIVVTWKNADGIVYAQKPVAGTDYSITFEKNSGWVEGADGFYYYTNEVKADKTGAGNGYMTAVLISEAKTMNDAPADGYTLSIEIVASAIQSRPDNVVGDQWKTVTANNGTLTVTNPKTAE